MFSFIHNIYGYKIVSHNTCFICIKSSVAEPHHFYAAKAPGVNFDAAPAPAPAPIPYCTAKQNF
jgi:hypothetical protein